jgi:hypothetical protein
VNHCLRIGDDGGGADDVSLLLHGLVEDVSFDIHGEQSVELHLFYLFCDRTALHGDVQVHPI